MLEHGKLNKLKRNESKLYDLQGFTPKIINESYLKELGVGVTPSKETLQDLQRGSSVLVKKYQNRSLLSKPSFLLRDISLDEPLKAHRYTSKCPVDVLEVDPMVGCNIGCLYCLVTDGNHSMPKVAYKNYGVYLRHKLEEDNGASHYYYFAPKSEPFQEATLQRGIAHDIFREFIAHFKKNPESKSKIFIISKAGKEELQYKHNGDTILDLMEELSGRLIYNTSITVMPPELYPILEPRAASNEKRLEAAVMCQESQIAAKSALVQPIIPPYLTDKTMDDLLEKLEDANIERFKPEFLTLNMENLAWISQLIGHFDKSMEKKLYELYIAPENMNNVKHRARLAPDRMFTRKAMLKLKNRADKYGLSMTLCHWVRSELDITPAEVPVTLRKNKIENKLIKIGVCKPV
jgi:DNA repair photolyase